MTIRCFSAVTVNCLWGKCSNTGDTSVTYGFCVMKLCSSYLKDLSLVLGKTSAPSAELKSLAGVSEVNQRLETWCWYAPNPEGQLRKSLKPNREETWSEDRLLTSDLLPLSCGYKPQAIPEFNMKHMNHPPQKERAIKETWTIHFFSWVWHACFCSLVVLERWCVLSQESDSGENQKY